MAKKMKRVPPKRKGVLLEIYENTLLRSKVDAALDAGMPYDDIIKIAKSYGVSVSAPTLSRYARARKEADSEGKDLKDVLDGNKKNALERLKKKEETPVHRVSGPVYVSDKAVLETVISRFYSGILSDADAPIPAKDALKAIEIKNKLDGGRNLGLSSNGLQELQLLARAKYTALTQALLKYVPEEHQHEAVDYMDKVEKEQIKQMEITPQNKEVLKVLEENGVKI